MPLHPTTRLIVASHDPKVLELLERGALVRLSDEEKQLIYTERAATYSALVQALTNPTSIMAEEPLPGVTLVDYSMKLRWREKAQICAIAQSISDRMKLLVCWIGASRTFGRWPKKLVTSKPLDPERALKKALEPPVLLPFPFGLRHTRRNTP